MISFIVPAYNEEALLERTLQSIQAAGRSLGKPYQVIVIDDASTDRTADIARQLAAEVVSVNHRQIAATRNAGARASQGEWLIFVDADTLVSTEAVRAAVEAMRHGAIGGGCTFHFDGRLPLYARLLATIGVAVYRALGLASGCFLFCTREAFEAVGGFDECLFGAEEAVMSRRLGRLGRFVVLREPVITSGRKLRTHSAREVLGLLLRLALTGPKSLRQRKGLELWYGDRRTELE
jgi:glycosyltransferase involved in cell wall biosynthesis